MANYQAIFSAEVIGTFLLCFLGNGVCANVIFKKSHGYKSGWIVVSFGWGFALTMSIFLSGSKGHLNPAMTLAIFVKNGEQADFVIIRMLGQLIGAFFGALCTYIVYFDHFFEKNTTVTQFALVLKNDSNPVQQQQMNSNLLNQPRVMIKARFSQFSQQVDSAVNEDYISYIGIFSTFPSIKNFLLNCISEALCTMVLALGIFALDEAKPIINSNFYNFGFEPFLVGILLTTICLCLGGSTGSCLNPARDVMPRLFHQIFPMTNKQSSEWEYSWVPIIGPFVGALLAVGVNKMASLSGVYDI